MLLKKKIRQLKPVKENPADYAKIRARIVKVFQRELYGPILKMVAEDQTRITNSEGSPLAKALSTGKVTFNRGVFSGKFNSSISRELQSIGAKWDRKEGVYRLSLKEIPMEYRVATASGKSAFERKLSAIDKKLSQILPEEIAQSVKVTDLFDKILWKTDKAIGKSLEAITISPQLTDSQRKKIAEDWQENLDLYIKDFTETEIPKLRKAVQKSAFAGNRYESLIASIKKSYGVSERKAEFLARQETNLLMTEFKKVRYTDAGVSEYKWKTVVGSPAHPVRPAHKKLEGTIQKWDDPPITTEPDEPVRRNHPGQDYNCRCYPIPIVRF